MIVRILEEGQFRLDDGLIGRLNELDNAVAAATAAGDEAEFRRTFDELIAFVESSGEPVGDTELVTSDHVLPYPRHDARRGPRRVHARRRDPGRDLLVDDDVGGGMQVHHLLRLHQVLVLRVEQLDPVEAAGLRAGQQVVLRELGGA